MATEEYIPGDLLIGDYPVITRTVTIAAGQELKRGAVLGDAGGSFKLSLAAAEDGSEAPALVLAVDVDSTAAAVSAPAYASGEFDAAKLTYGTGHTAATVEAAFRAASAPLYLRILA